MYAQQFWHGTITYDGTAQAFRATQPWLQERIATHPLFQNVEVCPASLHAVAHMFSISAYSPLSMPCPGLFPPLGLHLQFNFPPMMEMHKVIQE